MNAEIGDIVKITYYQTRHQTYVHFKARVIKRRYDTMLGYTYYLSKLPFGSPYYITQPFIDKIAFNFTDNWKKIRAAKTIQFCWRRCVTHPDFFICRKRLLKEFDEISG